MFLLLYRDADDSVFDNFPKISENSPNFVQMSHEHCRTFPENFRRFPKTFEEDLKVFRPYTNELEYDLRDKLGVSEIVHIFTTEDMENKPPESWMWFATNFTSVVFSSKTLVSL